MLSLRKFPVAKKSMDEGGIKIFHQTFFLLRVPKNSVIEHFCAVFQKISGCEKLYG